MALSTYSELQEAALSVVGREGDSSLTAYAPVAVMLVEAKLNRKLQVGDMEASTTLTGAGGVFTLPDDFAGWRDIKDPSYGSLKLATPDWASATYPTNGGGIPQFFTIKGRTLTTFPASSSTLGVDYYEKIPRLSDSAPTNWVLLDYYDVYLFLTVSELYAFAKNYEEALTWNQRGMLVVDEINELDKRKRYSRASARVKGPTP